MNAAHRRIPFFHSVRGRLLLYFLPLALIPLITVSLLAYVQARDALQQAASDKLEAVRAIKKYQVENYLAEREAAAYATADLVNMLRQQALARLTDLRDAKQSAVRQIFAEWKADLLDLSTNPDFTDHVTQLSSGFTGLGADQVRALYLGKPELNDAGDGSNYSAAHAPVHETLSGYNRIHGYENVLLIDPAGTVVYSVQKGPRFGVDLDTAQAGQLSALYQQLKTASPGEIAVADIDLLDDEVVMFMGTPIYSGTTRLGTLAYQLPYHQIDEIMQVPADLRSSSETYLVGSDKRMRSQSTLDPDNRSVVASLTGTLAQNGVDTACSRAALAGATGTDLFLNYQDRHTVCAYAPLDIGGLNWAILVEQDVAEAIVPQVEGTGMYMLTQYAQRYGYQDVLLMAEDGYVFHTIMRGPDYRTNLLTGPYRTTQLGQLAADVLKTGELGFADFAPYLPAGNRPVAFVAAPVSREDKTQLVVALQLPPGWTDAVMQERTGMGETGETLLVGPDLRLRSNSYLDPAGHSVEASFVGPIEKSGMDNWAVREALAGNTSEFVQQATDYLSQEVLVAYAPVKFGDLNWALIAKQNVDEAFAQIQQLSWMLWLIVGLAAVLISMAALWLANKVSDPVLHLADAAEDITAGNLEVETRVDTTRRDELGVLARAFTSMTAQLRELIGDLEQRVHDRTIDLETANKELESFSYSVSHDLRAPLRAIDGYTRILLEDYEATLDAEGRRVCGVIRNETQRMGALIDDLLAFSRLSRAAMQTTSINMETLVQIVFTELTTAEDRARIDFQLDALPAARGDPMLIRQVWVNLLANAVKFSSKQPQALIQVTAEQTATELIYAVSDNGAGFDPQYADKLFGVFQRLHSEREFPGTGVGLAIVQRIIHRHGGRVWAAGAVGQGAMFYFSLPCTGA